MIRIQRIQLFHVCLRAGAVIQSDVSKSELQLDGRFLLQVSRLLSEQFICTQQQLYGFREICFVIECFGASQHFAGFIGRSRPDGRARRNNDQQRKNASEHSGHGAPHGKTIWMPVSVPVTRYFLV